MRVTKIEDIVCGGIYKIRLNRKSKYFVGFSTVTRARSIENTINLCIMADGKSGQFKFINNVGKIINTSIDKLKITFDPSQILFLQKI